MNVLIVLSLSLVILGIVSYLLGKRSRIVWPTDDVPLEEQDEEGDECCGRHLVCEKENLASAMSKEIEYYDDEELDVFRLKDPAAYDEEEIESFRSVLYTLAEQEVEGWLISLQLREVALPLALRDEAFLLIREQRTGTTT